MQEYALRKRNFLFLTIEGTFFMLGMAFLDANSVIPVFIDSYTGSLQLAGLATTLNAASSMLTQLLTGPYVPGIKNMPRYIQIIMFLFRPLPLVMIPVLFANANPYLTVWIFLILYTLLWASDGLIVVPWSDLFGRTIPGNRRGKLLGYQQLFGGIGGLAAGFIIKSALENPVLSNGARYSIIFGCAGLMLTISAAAMLPVKDLPRKVLHEKVNFREYFGKMPHYFMKNKDYANMAILRIISSFTGMVMPFVILFGKNVFHLNASQVSTLIYVQIVGNLIGGILWGNISHRLGNKYVIMTSQILGFILSGLALANLVVSSWINPILLFFPMALLTGINMGNWLGFLNYTIDVVDEEERPTYLVLNSILSFPLSFLAYFAGLIADIWGFTPLFIISVTAAAFCILWSMRLKSPSQLKNAE